MELVTNSAQEVLKVDTTVYSDSDNPIASWPAEKGGFFAKIYQTNKKIWLAITNPNHKGRGLIVFVKTMPKHGEKLKITRVSKAVAYADLV